MDEVFRALADPTRRAVLDALFLDDGQTVGELCDRFAEEMSRYGVMKHLRVLEDAGLVTTARAGRSKRIYLNPVPIQEIADRWIGKYAAPYTAALVDLRRGLEHGHEQTRPDATRDNPTHDTQDRDDTDRSNP